MTHGLFTVKEEWKRCRDGLPVAFDTFHRDDQPEVVRAATGDRAPVVLAETDGGLVVLLDGMQIEAADGDPQHLMQEIDDRVAAAALTWS